MSTKIFHVALAFLIGFIFLTEVYGGRLGDFTRRKGYGAHLKRNTHEEARQTNGANNFRFLNPKTER